MKRTELKRTPMKRKAAKPRRVAAKCSVLRCKRRPTGTGMCATHSTAVADRLWSRRIRDRDAGCTAARAFPEMDCNGSLQAMHLVSRRYHATRWTLDNGRAGCAAHHTYLTLHPLEHLEFCERVLGVDGWRRMRDAALAGARQDLVGVIALLSDEAAA